MKETLHRSLPTSYPSSFSIPRTSLPETPPIALLFFSLEWCLCHVTIVLHDVYFDSVHWSSSVASVTRTTFYRRQSSVVRSTSVPLPSINFKRSTTLLIYSLNGRWPFFHQLLHLGLRLDLTILHLCLPPTWPPTILSGTWLQYRQGGHSRVELDEWNSLPKQDIE